MDILVVILFTFHWTKRGIFNLEPEFDESNTDFQQFDILTCEDSDEPVQPPLTLRNSKLCSVSSLTIKEYSSNQESLGSDWAYAQDDLRLCWSHIPHCWKSHALAHL